MRSANAQIGPATAGAVRPGMRPVDAMRRRIVGAVIAAAALGVLSVAAFLEPATEGIGTHQVFNLPQCGWIVTMGIPCPTCGMTTAFAHAANGDLLSSVLAQPLGCLMALATAMAAILGLHAALTGSRVAATLTRLWGRRTGWILAGLVLAAWGYKILSYKELL